MSASLLLSVVSKYTFCFSIAQWAVFMLRLCYEYTYNRKYDPDNKWLLLRMHGIVSLLLVIPTTLLLVYSIIENKKAVPMLIIVVNVAGSIYQVWRAWLLKWLY
jgi:hypothetical protein